LVDGVTRCLERSNEPAFVEAFARVSLLEWARQHGGQSPSPSSPEYLRFVVEQWDEIKSVVKSSRMSATWARGLHAAMGQFPSIIDEFNRDGLRGNAEGLAVGFCRVARGRITADEIVEAYRFRAELAATGADDRKWFYATLNDNDNQRMIQRLLDIINAEVVEPAIRAEREAEDKRVAAEINAK
jgi:hypothetical protein